MANFWHYTLRQLFILFVVTFFANYTYGQVCALTDLPTNLRTGLVGFYPFCANANDASGNSINGTVTGATLTTDRYGVANRAYNLNGTNQYITIPDANSVNDFTTQFSISVWINPVLESGRFGEIIGKWGIGGANNAAYGLWINGSGQLTALIHSSSTNSGPSNIATSITSNNWYHIVYTFKNGVIKVYVNGALLTTYNGTLTSTQNSIYNIDIGREAYGNYTYYKGKVDDILLYNRELTACEAQQLYQTTDATASAGTLSGTQTICVGGTTTFSSTVSGGTWSSSATSIATINSSTGAINGLSAGSATMTYTVTGCTDVTSTRTVTVSAAPTSGSLSVLRQFCTNAALSSSLQNSLLSFYPMCGNLSDGNNSNSLSASGTTLITGPYDFTNSAYNFNGTNSEMTIPYQSWYSNLTDNFSVSFWIKNNLNSGHLGAQILWRSDGNLSVGLNGNNTISFNRQGIVSLATSNSTIGSSWTHVVMTKSGSNNQIYINGVLDRNSSNATLLNNTVNDPMIIGRASPGGNGGAYRFNGGLAQLMFYNRVLSTNDINSIYLESWNTICEGGTSTYTSTVTGGTWSSSASNIATIDANTGAISGVAAGNATITYTVAGSGGCANATATRNVTVTAAPSAATLSGNNAICVGGTSTFSSTVTGGTWTSSTTSVATINSSTGAISGISAGTSTITYAVTGSGGCTDATATRVITVTATNTAGAASSTPTLCVNTVLTNITHTTTGATGIGTATGLPTGVTATWASNRITISGTPTQGGTFNYSIPLTGGCGSVNATGTITVTAANTAGAASSTPTLCINTALTNITHTTTGATGISTATGLPAGVTAAWASNRITISGTPTQSGTFSYSIPLTGGCGSVNATGTITVTAANTASAASSTPTLCINTALTNITHTTTGATGIGTATGLPAGVTAAWASNVITISGTPTASGTFSYSIPLTGGCGSVSATGTITVTAANTAGAASSLPTLCINTALTNITHTTTGATGIGTATGLPAGVTAAWASNRITIIGTPTLSGTFSYSIPLTGGCGSVNATGTITVTAANTASAASSTPTLCINTALSNITHTTTGATGIGTATGLPTGVTAAWASNRITISGTPTQSGTYNYSIPLTGGCGNINATGTITVTARPVAGTLDGTQEICVLGSTTFSSTVSGGSWSSSASTLATVDATSGLVTGIAVGTATITYTITGTGGCSDVSATRTVTVTAPPTAGVLSGTQDICIAGTTTLSSTVSGGTWSSSTITVATIDATTGAVAGIAAGTSTMTYTVTGTGGCADVSATRVITVTTPPSTGLLSGPQDICVAGTTPLTSTVSGGTWSSSATSVATINATSGVATGVAAGIAIMTYTVAGTGGCANATSTRLVTVSAAPSAGTLSGTQAICVSSSVLFNSTSPGGSWSSSNSLIATIDAVTGSVSGIAPGTAIITYVVPGTGGCANTSATRTVTVTAAPNAGTLSDTQAICIAGTSSFSSSVTGGTWSSSATSIATINSTSGLVTGIAAGTATMTYTVIGTGGCVNATATRTVTVTAAPVAGTLSGTQAICIAGTSTLTSSITGGTWTTSNGSIATINSSTGFVTGVAAGTATMTYTIVGTGGCANATATRLINVTAPPSAGTLSGVQAICVAGTSSFNSSITGGSWTSSDNTIAAINNTTGFITGISAGTATMTYTTVGTGGCTDATATRTVTVTTPPVAGTLTGGASICITGTTVFSSTISGGTWTSSNNSIASISATTGVVTGVDAGTAIMTYTVAGTGGCANVTATRNVIVNPNNTVTAPSSLPTLCINALLTPITHTTTGATGIGTASGLPLGVSASWLSNSISISGTPQQSGTFNYSIPLSGGCGRDSAVGVIIVRPDNIVSAPSSTPTVCINSSLTPITFTTTGATGIGTATGLPAGVVATWSSNIITVNGTPTQSGTFTYSIPLTGGCGTVDATGVIVVAPLPTGTITSSTNLLCEGGNVQLTATGGNTYQWFINGGAIVGATNATHAATQPGTYTVNLISSNNCVAPATGSVTLQLVQKPTANFSYNKYCAGFPTQFTDQSNTANSNVVTYSWSFGTGQGTSTLQNPTYTFPTASTYSVSLVVTPVPCPSLAASITKPITTVAPPANQRYTSLNAVENRDLQLTSRTFSGSSYSWSPSTGLSSTTTYNPVFNYNTEVDYVITITTGIGCVIKDTQLVRIFKEKEIYVPKGFSPNGDNNNDKIFPRLVGVRSLTYFKVFNRWGKLLFQTSNLNEGWDGTFRGTKQPMETYVWIAEGIDIDNNSIKRTGTFLLVR